MPRLRALRYLRLQPFDTATAEGRVDERYRLAALAAMANLLYRGLGLLNLLLGISLTLPYLGAQRFGLWTTVASLASVLSFLDLGIGNAMVSAVAQQAARNDRPALAALIGRGLLLLAAVGLAIGLMLELSVGQVPLSRVFRELPPQNSVEALQTLRLFAVLFACNIPAQAVLKVYAGLQWSWRANSLMAAASLLSLVAIVLAAQRQADVPTLLAASFGVPALAPLALLAGLYRQQLLGLHGLAEGFRASAARLCRQGALFFGLQLGMLAGWGSDALLVSARLSVAAVALLAVVQRLFDLVVQVLALVNAPLWAAYADALARQDHGFLRTTLRRSLLGTALAALAGASLLLIAHPLLLRWWLHEVPAIPAGFVIATAAWTVVLAVGNAWAMYMNGCSIVSPQLAVILPFSAAALGFKWLLLPQLGVTAVPLVTLGCYLLLTVVPYFTLFRRRLLAPLRESSAEAAS